MSDNIIQYAQIFQSELDKHMVAQSTSGWMELNSDLIKYNGGNEVKIASIVMDGLANYSRRDGFPSGSVSLSFETLKFTQDRARTFSIDAMDVDESNFALTAANVLGVFQSDYVIPEVDSYRYSKIAQIAVDNGKAATGYTPATATVWEKLTSDIAMVQDIIGEEKQLVITMSIGTSKILNSNDKMNRRIDVTNFAKGEIETRVQAIDGIPIIRVPFSRLYTKYIFKPGTAEGESGGFEKAPDTKKINWIITAKESPVAVSKTEAIRIFDPEENINAHAWKIDYRRYHDLWIPKNKVDGVFVNIE